MSHLVVFLFGWLVCGKKNGRHITKYLTLQISKYLAFRILSTDTFHGGE